MSWPAALQFLLFVAGCFSSCAKQDDVGNVPVNESRDSLTLTVYRVVMINQAKQQILTPAQMKS